MSAQPTQPSLHDTLRGSPPTIPVFAGASWRDQVERHADAYHHDGFVVVQALFDRDAVAGWQAECERLWHDEQLADPESFRVDSRKTLRGASIAERMDPVTDVSPVFATLARHPDILGIGAVLLGEEPVLFKDKLIFKMPGTTGYPLHQDFAYITDFGFSGDRLDSEIHAAQSFRNQSVGSRCSSAASGPRLAAVIRTRMSSGAALAYSTKTSK